MIVLGWFQNDYERLLFHNLKSLIKHYEKLYFSLKSDFNIRILTKKFPKLDANIIAIIRKDKTFIPKKNDKIECDDKIYVIINSSQMKETQTG